MFEYAIRIHKEFGYSLDYILYDLPMILGWLLHGWSYANDPINRFGGIQLTESPTAKEADILFEELKKLNANQ